jgi:hypothetical protein
MPYHHFMRIELRDERHERLGRVEVDPSAHPTRVHAPEADRDVILSWDSALDDAGRLRRCLVCGSTDMYRAKAFPQITGLVIVAAFAGAVIGALGLATPPMLMGMIIVLIIDIGILFFVRESLVCYQCRTAYRDLQIARYHDRWDRTVAERFQPAGSEEGGVTPSHAAEPEPRAVRERTA